MIKERIRALFQANKNILHNFSFYGLFQLTTIASPLIIYPYVIRILKADLYGLIALAEAIITYFIIFISFGFNYTATKRISQNRENKEKLNEIVSGVYLIKGVFFLFSFLVIFTLDILNILKGPSILYYISMWMCLCEWLNLQWYFHGIERLNFLATTTAIGKVITIILIFLTVKSKDDYLMVPIVKGIGGIFTVIASIYITFYVHKIKFKLVPINTLLGYVKQSSLVFVSNISIRAVSLGNRVILGSVAGLQVLAYYDLGDKILGFLKLPQDALNRAVFPKISKEKNITFVRKMLFVSVSINIVVMIFAFLLANWAILFLGGESMSPASKALRILVLSLPIAAICNVFGFQMLIPLGLEKIFTRVNLESVFLFVLQMTALFFLYEIDLITTSFSVLTIELYIALRLYFITKKKKII